MIEVRIGLNSDDIKSISRNEIKVMMSERGDDGRTPIKGVDYFTEIEKLELIREVESGVMQFAQGFYNKEEKIPAAAIQDDITHRFVTDIDKANWDSKEDKVKIVDTLAETTEKGIYIVEDDTNVYDDLIANGARIETFIAIVDRVEQTTDNGLWIIKESDIDG